MDRKENHEARDRRREELLARRLAEALDQRRPPGANDCPDAEIIAAYAEQALESSESAACEAHFATCARCRTVLKVLTGSADAPLAEEEVAHLGELVGAARSPAQTASASAESSRPKFIDWRMRWLAPALGAAAVLAVLLVWRPLQRATQPSSSGTLVAQAPKQEPTLPLTTSEVDRASRAAPAAGEEQKKGERTLTAPRGDSSLALDSSSTSSSTEALAKRRAEETAKLDSMSPTADEKFKNSQGSGGIQAPSATSSAQPAPPPPKAAPASPQLQANAAPNAPTAPAPQIDSDTNAIGGLGSREKQAVMAQSEPVQQAGSEPAKKEAAAEAKLNKQKAQVFALARPTQKDAAMLKTPSGSTIWRAGLAGKIERSVDGGKTWVPQASPSNADWLAGAAVSDSACWLVGRHGAIAQTIDGDRWELVSSPAAAIAPNGLPPDWVAVTAPDAQTATITSADGRKFATADAGKTWRPQ